MKRVIALLLALAVMVCFAACVGKNKEEEKAEPETTVQTEPVTEPSEEATQPTTPAVTTPTKKVNLSKLNYMERNSEFPVKLTEKKIIEDYYTLGDAEYDFAKGNDVIKITIENSTGKVMTEVTLMLLATDGNAQRVTLTNEFSIGTANDLNREYPCVKVMSLGELWLANGESKSGIIRCAADKFENINIIVYSYKDADGKEIVNEDYEEWLENTLPV